MKALPHGGRIGTMTMRITKDQKIAGIAAIGVRNVLQNVYDDSPL